MPDVPLRPLAVVALRDELRPRVVDVLAGLAAQGIRLKVVSGDHPETVRATVRALGAAFGEQSIVTGDEWANSADRVALAERCDLFGRVSPEQKVALVAALQQAGHRVGMIGDGVNDVLPIKRADFGVAMGAGSQAAKAVGRAGAGVERFRRPARGPGRRAAGGAKRPSRGEVVPAEERLHGRPDRGGGRRLWVAVPVPAPAGSHS